MVPCHEIFDHFLGLKRFDLETNGNRQKRLANFFIFEKIFAKIRKKRVSAYLLADTVSTWSLTPPIQCRRGCAREKFYI